MTPEAITNGVKKHKNKIVGYGSLSVLATMLFFFWDLGVSKSDLQALPQTNKNVATLMEERPKVAEELRQATKSIDSLIIVLGFTNKLLEDLKEQSEANR